MFTFTLSGLLCLTKYGLPPTNSSFFIYEPLDEPLVTYRLESFDLMGGPVISTYHTSNGMIFMNNKSLLHVDNMQRWEVITEREVLYVDNDRALIHRVENVTKAIYNNVTLFTFDRVYRNVYIVVGSQIFVHHIDTGMFTNFTADQRIRDIECSASSLLIYDYDYNVWFNGEIIATTNRLAVIPFLAFVPKENSYMFVFLFLIPCGVLVYCFTDFYKRRTYRVVKLSLLNKQF